MSFTGSSTPKLRFGPFELDMECGELRQSGVPVKLHGQPLKVLALLAGRPGQLISRDDIRREIWGDDTNVDFDQGLNFCIKQIRTWLGDDARTPQYVETLPRRGYRFIAPVSVEGAEPVPAPPPAPHPAPARRPRLRWWLLPLGAAALAAALYIAVGRPAPPRKTMLLVLPFENMSGDPTQEYFSDGMTEEMSTHIGRLAPKDLGVIARTSAMRYKFTAYDSRDIAEIGRELGADYILEGSVRLDGQRVRITANLTQVRDRSYIWSESYDRDLRDVLTLQSEVAYNIARQIYMRIAGRLPGRMAAPRPVRADAYDLYLRGRFFWNKRTHGGMSKAASLFGEAVRIDPAYAAAHAGIADAYTALGHYGALPPHEAYLRAKAAALKALEIDPDLSEAHTALAAVKVDYEWDWQGGEKGFERAVELNPNYATAHQWFAHYWSAVGRPAKAIEEIRRALELDPLSPLLNSALGRHLYHAGRYDEAAAQLRKTLELDPNFALARLHLGWVYEARGLYREAIGEYEKSASLTGREPATIAAAARAYAASGHRAKAAKLLSELLDRAGREYVSPFHIALVQYAMGDAGAAFEWLEKACAGRSPSLVYLPRHPWTAAMRSDPRCAAVSARLKLP